VKGKLAYMAPEAVSGNRDLDARSDIWAAGVILHEMLTGLAPYRATREGKALTDLSLLQEETEVPSRLAVPKPLARLLAGDLDAIILKAMRRDPEHRYASVELFDADVLAHLDRKPVKARAGTWRYLAGRFALRHKLPLATAAAVLVTLLGGLVMAERERRVAVTEKARAERHFASVRNLANTFIFDVHARIENLPGSLAAREMLIRTSLEYLDALAGETDKDPALMYEIASAYRNIGNIQGQPGSANKGDLNAAIGNFEKSRGLFIALQRLKPDDIATLREHWNLSYALARAYFLKADGRWQRQIATTIELARRLAASPGATRGDRALVAGSLVEKAHLTSLMSGLSPEVAATMTHATASLEALVREEPGNVDLRVALATAYSRAGTALARSGRTPASVQHAIVYLRKSRALARELASEFPDDRTKLAFAAGTDFDLAQLHGIAGEHGEADRAIVEALTAIAAHIARDPADVSLALDRVKILAEATLIAHRLGDQPRAIARGREALVAAQRLPEGIRSSRDLRGHVAESKAYLGYALLASSSGAGDRTRQLAALQEARGLLAGAAAFMAEVRAENLGDIPEDEAKELDAAVKRCDEALASLGSV
jgi:tetratricopeptide (TPR) repeat protein